MGSSYFITYGGNRVTFPGTPGPVAWEYLDPMVVVDPLSNGYLTMEFTTPGGDTITLDSQMSSASARVPVGSTASWTAHAFSGQASSRNVLTAYNMVGFSGVSADIPVSTSLYKTPELTGYGSGVLTSNTFASAECDTVKFNRCSYGQGTTSWNTKISASSFAGSYDDGYDTAAGRIVWVPEGGRLSYMASSISGRTFSFSTSLTSLDNYGVNFNHKGIGTTGAVTGYMNEPRGFFLANGRNKNVFATGYNRVLGAAQGTASAAAWQPLCIITAFSSNLSTGSSLSTYLTGSANAGDVHGFASGAGLGVMKNSAGTWSSITSGTNTYKWDNRYFMANSAFFSGTFSAMRTKGPTGSNNATYVFYGKGADNSSVSRVSGQFALPTASAKTATKTASGSFSTTTFGVEAFAIMSNTVAQRSSLCANCVGYWTASGRVV
jgi:hypothetical protein